MTRVDPEIMDFYDSEVVKCIVGKYGYDEREAFSMFLSSETYRMLANPKMEMWDFGPSALFNMWEAERITGTPRRSAYLRAD